MKKMKKAMSAILASAMVMSMGMTAMADTSDNVTASTATEFTFKKNYVVSSASNAAKATVLPQETLTFTIDGASNNPDDTMISIKDDTNKIGSQNPASIVLTIPSYTKVGKYNYTVKENMGTTQGVTYAGAYVTFGVQVVATYNTAHTAIETQVVFTTVDGTTNNKIDSITNIYELGALDVSKEVTGNLGSTTKDFNVDVTFTVEDGKTVLSDITYVDGQETKSIPYSKLSDGTETVTVTVKDGETVKFTNIPYGVTWKVDEQDYTQGDINAENGYDAPSYAVNGTKVTTTKKEMVDGQEKEVEVDVENVSNKISTEKDAVKITNNKGTSVDTGISLDNMPYFMVLAMVALGLVGFVSKKRSNEF